MSVKALCSHFGLHSLPFTRAVPQDALFQHKSFVESAARIHHALEARTPVLLTAEPGLGKSTLLAFVSERFDKSTTRLLYTALCACGPFGLIAQLAMRYGVKVRRSAAQTATAVLDALGTSGKTEILMLDEAHRLPRETLDELRLICNTDFDRTPPFALLLSGQPPLRAHLAAPELASLWQRIPFRTTLSPLSDRETADYVEGRLRAVGATTMLFRNAAVNKLFEISRGVPREINNLATNAMLSAATAGRKHVDLPDIDAASFEMEHA